ncbi:MAG: hypothetical protein JW908_15050 [Anaerolineales bacterium]|nr:hypothetical protein [Anaerolineales bacterium]
MRPDVYNLFALYEPQFQYKWNRIIASGFDDFAAELARLAGELDLHQSVDGRKVFWVDAQGCLEALFCYIIDPQDLESILSMYQDIKEKQVPVSYAIIEQREDGLRQYDIFRISEKSYLEHCNRAWVPGTSADE